MTTSRGRLCMMRSLLVALLAVSLAGCGFTLRSAPELSPALQYMHIDASGSVASDLVLDLSHALRQSGVTVLDQPDDDVAVLEILRDRVSRRVVSVDSDGRALEFELRMDIAFRVRRGDEDLLSRQTLMLNREFAFDQRVLGSEDEGERLVDDMRDDAVRQIMRRLQTVTGARDEPAGDELQ